MDNFKKDIIVFISIFGTLTLPFLFTDLDITIQSYFYNSVSGWFLQSKYLWDFLYKYGIFLGYFMTLVALAIISASYWRKSLIKWRKVSFLILFTMALGPGVLVNATFKEHWGRPRPREIKQFNGTEEYIKPWVKGNTNGKSFPCGHASMGFIISIPFLYLRKKYKTWAWIFLIFGLIYGGLIGYARMVAGGHFASDVLWSAGMVWLAGIIGYYLLKVYKDINEDYINYSKQKKRGKIVTIIMGIIVPLLTIFALLFTPYISKKEFHKDIDTLKSINPKSLSVNITEGIVNLSFTKDFDVKYQVNAFGLPNSRIGIAWNKDKNAILTLEESGWFTEVRNNIDIKYPHNNLWKNNLNVENGKIFIMISSDTIPKNLNINLKKGDITIYIPSNYNLNLITKNNINFNNNYVLNSKLSPFTLSVNIIKGEIYIKDILPE